MITHVAFRDASTAGDALSAITALATSRTINDGESLTIAAGALSFTFA